MPLTMLPSDGLHLVLQSLPSWHDRMRAGTSCQRLRRMVDAMLIEQLTDQLRLDPDLEARVERAAAIRNMAHEAFALLSRAEDEGTELMQEAEAAVENAEAAFETADASRRVVFCALHTVSLAHHKQNAFAAAGLLDKVVALLDATPRIYVSVRIKTCPCYYEYDACPLKDVPSEGLMGGVAMPESILTLRCAVLDALKANRAVLSEAHVDRVVAIVCRTTQGEAGFVQSFVHDPFKWHSSLMGGHASDPS